MSLIRGPGKLATTRTVPAVQAQAERTGALILAEGIETVEHLEIARLSGARLGQGWYFGRPGALPARRARGRSASTSGLLMDLVARRPADVPAIQPTPLEQRALVDPEPPVLLSCFQDVRHLTARTRARYAELAAVSPFVAAIGQGVPV